MEFSQFLFRGFLRDCCCSIYFLEGIARFYFRTSWKLFSRPWPNEIYLLSLKEYYSYVIVRVII